MHRVAKTAHTVLPIVGLSILFPYLRGFFLSPIKVAGIHDLPVLEGAFYAYAVSFMLCAAAVFLLGERLARALSGGRLLYALGAAGSVGLMMLWMPSAGWMEPALCVAGSVVNVLFFIACLLRYIMALRGFGMVRTVAIVSLGFGLCFASNMVYLLPVTLQAVACVASPLVAVVCAPPVRTDGSSAPQASSPRLFYNVAPMAFFVLLALFCLTGNFIRGVTNPWFAINAITVQTLYMSLANIALVAVTLLLLYRDVPVNRVIFINWIIYILMFFAGLLVMVIAPAESSQHGSNLATTSRVGFSLLMMLFVLSSEDMLDEGIARRTSLFLLIPEAISAVVRHVAVPVYLASSAAEPALLVTYGGTVVVFVLSAAIVLVLGSLLLRSSEGSLSARPLPESDPLAAQERIDGAVVGELTERYGLTPREADVVRRIGQGYSLDRTAELLGVSVNTVRTHSRSIYAKLGIHNRQELVELIQQAKLDLSRDCARPVL